MEVICAENEIVFKDRDVTQNCEHLKKVLAKQECERKNLPIRFVLGNQCSLIKKTNQLQNKKGMPMLVSKDRYTDIDLVLSEILDDSTVISNFDDDKQYIIREFPILNQDIDSKLFKDKQIDKFVYTGYYSVKLASQAQITTEAQDDTSNATEDNQVSRAETQVGFCSDQSCSTMT
ncbi:unnamed protein product [Paramecium pentaurelia]|uniref:Uncharacterized protein n=1 Tax=Paramecium pentaurelia TaxID=43138 RepID=A0A8S1V3W2_9CILI|nr:unnamed protein product [Paramecium pentaurelia]